MGSSARHKAIIVHHLDHARAALAAASELDVGVTLRSAPGAHAHLGPAVFRAIISAARAEFPLARCRAVLDCGDSPGHALSAFRHGIESVRVDLPAETRARVADIGARYGAVVDDDPAPALDLLDRENPAAACRNWLAATLK